MLAGDLAEAGVEVTVLENASSGPTATSAGSAKATPAKSPPISTITQDNPEGTPEHGGTGRADHP
ncbi:hypothetical protein L0U85_04945 [Glycomyces sp. L485]|nr:hypothetical protein [Glycomyces sp. L485]